MSTRLSTLRGTVLSGLLLGAGILALLGSPQAASAAQIIAVDYDGNTGEGGAPLFDTQPGFTGVTSMGPTALPGGYSTSILNPTGSQTGFFSRAGVSNNGAFTEAQLYQDFFYTQNGTFTGNSSATIQVAGLKANTPYELTFYTFDASNSIGPGPFTTSFTGTSGTTGAGTLASYTTGVPPYVYDGGYLSSSPTSNGEYTSTGVYTSDGTGTINVLAALTSNNDFLRINGFTVDTVSSVPEPASLSLLGLGVAGLFLARQRKVKHS